MNGADQRRQRRLVASALQRRQVEGYADVIADLARRTFDGWSAGAELDLLAEMRQLTMTVAVRTLLGLPPGSSGAMASTLLQDWLDTVFSVPALALPVDLPGLPYRRLMLLSARLEDVVRQLIARRRSVDAAGTDVLSRLMAAREDGTGLTDDELIGQTTFLFIAGHATTASALTWTLLLLCAHPAVLHDVLDEVDGPSHGDPVTVTRLPAMPLLDRVVKESLRLLPPVMWWSKVTTAPVDLGTHRVGARARVVFSPYITHRRPELYPEPDSFRPQRWLDCEPGPYEYLPFSAGQRTCLGSGFAMMEIKLILTELLRRWQINLRPKLRVDCGGLMVSQPKRGLPAHIDTRNGLVTKPEIHGAIRSLVDIS
jgi:cytochrome P450